MSIIKSSIGIFVFFLSVVVWFAPSFSLFYRYSWPITYYYNSLLADLPDFSSSWTSQHSIARISFHTYHFYHRNLHIKIGNRIKCELFSLFLKFMQPLFTTHIYLNNPFSSLPPSFTLPLFFSLSTSPISLVSHLKFLFKPHLACCHQCVTCYFQSSDLLQMPFSWIEIPPAQITVFLNSTYLFIKTWLNYFGKLSTITSDCWLYLFNVS